jgi:hypothetical protein
MTFQATMQRGACEVWERRLQGIQTVIQRQQCRLAKRDNQRFLLQRQGGGTRLLRAHRRIMHMRPFLPLGDRLGIEMIAFRKFGYALLTMLDRATQRRGRAGAAVE